MKRTIFIFALTFFFVTSGCRHEKISEAEKFINKVQLMPGLEKALKKNHDEVKTIVIQDYTDTIFPNEDLLKFKNLESLNITGHIPSLKKESGIKPIKLHFDSLKMKEMKNLKYLRLTDFDFQIFPQELFCLTNLKALSIDLCNVDSLPKEICKLKSLEGLEVRVNNLTTLPTTLLQMDSLKILDLANNKFKIIPPVLNDAVNLEKINLLNPEGGEMAGGPDSPVYFGVHDNVFNFRDPRNDLTKILQHSSLKYIYINVFGFEDKAYVPNHYATWINSKQLYVQYE